MGKLLHCPFCAEPVTLRYSSVRRKFIVEHKVYNRFCIIEEIAFREESLASATAAWNRRAGDDTNVATNADRIRSMSDEELARFLGDEPPYLSTYDKYLEWLQQPAKEEHHEDD